MAAPPLPQHPPLSVVTGVSVGGIGLEVAAGLRQAGHRVILASRNPQRCSAAKAELDSRDLPGSCECRALDLSDYASIRAFAAELAAARAAAGQAGAGTVGGTPSVAVLVNNAGVMGAPTAPSGECGHFQVNHLGPYLLTRLLLPLMAPAGRVVTVASEAHRRGSLRINSSSSSSSSGGSSSSGSGKAGAPLASAKSSSSSSCSSDSSVRLQVDPPPSYWYAAYARSKLANVLCTAELARQLAQRGSTVTAYSVSPGRVNTAIFANVPGPLASPLRWLASLAFQTPAQGAHTVLHAALAPGLHGKSELYMHDQRPCRAAPAAHDAALAAQLWQLSNQETGLSAGEDAALWPPR